MRIYLRGTKFLSNFQIAWYFGLSYKIYSWKFQFSLSGFVKIWNAVLAVSLLFGRSAFNFHDEFKVFKCPIYTARCWSRFGKHTAVELGWEEIENKLFSPHRGECGMKYVYDQFCITTISDKCLRSILFKYNSAFTSILTRSSNWYFENLVQSRVHVFQKFGSKAGIHLVGIRVY